MELFCVKPTVHYFDTVKEFINTFGVGAGDLILTETLMYDMYLKDKNLECPILLKDQYDPGEPKEEVIDQLLLEMKKYEFKRLIAIGGGSVIDIAKVSAVKDSYPIGRVMRGEVPHIYDKELIILPTTCGTGSEVTFGGIVTMKDTGFKTAAMSSTLSANHAVLIPELLSSLPLKVFMHCSVDALGHSMESYVSATRSNELARAMGAKSVELILDGYVKIIEGGEEARKALTRQFIIGSCMGGMAVNNGGAGPVHALAYPLGEVYKMSHGESIYQFLTAVFSHYEKQDEGVLLGELKEVIRPYLRKAGVESDSVFVGLEMLLNKIYPQRSLSEAGMKESDITGFVENIFEAKQRLLAASYNSFTKEDAARIYLQRL